MEETENNISDVLVLIDDVEKAIEKYNIKNPDKKLSVGRILDIFLNKK